MQIRLTGEQPFQVLSTTFTIGPSADGYDLMFSADGVNYSKLFTVGANTNRQVTQVAAGSYYYLAGNTGNVVVNWFGNCVVDNGGGGGGTQYTAGDGIQISGSAISVKAGEGLSFSGDTLIATGGGGAEVKTIELSTLIPDDFTQEDISAMTEMVEYLADFPVNGLPMARIACSGMYYNLGFIDYVPEDTERQTPEERIAYRFSYVEVCGDDGFTDVSENVYIQTFYLNAENVEESFGKYWDSIESAPNKLAAVEKLDEEVNDPQAGDVAAKKIVKYKYVKFAWDNIPAFDGSNIIELGNLVVTADVENATDTLYFANDYDVEDHYITGGTDWVGVDNGDSTSWSVRLEDGVISISLNDQEGAVWLEEDLLTLNECDAYFDEETVTPDGLYQFNGEEWEKLGGGNSPRVILLNDLSQQELVDLYDEITAMYDYDNMEFTTAFTASNYAFYLDLTDSTKQTNIGVYDRNFEGWFPVVLNYVNPNDFDGGAIYFTGVEGRQDGNGYLFNIRYIVNNQGSTEAGCWVVEPPQPDYQHGIQITSGGTFENPDELGIFSSENFNHKVMFVWREGNDQPGWGQAPLKYVWRKLDQNDKLVYYFAVENIPIDGVLYRGTWHATEDDWWNYTTDSWAAV